MISMTKQEKLGQKSCKKLISIVESQHEKIQQNECVPSEDSDQPGHPPSLIKFFAVHLMGSQGPKLSSC